MINSSWLLAELLGGNVHAESEEIVSCHGSLGKAFRDPKKPGVFGPKVLSWVGCQSGTEASF